MMTIEITVPPNHKGHSYSARATGLVPPSWQRPPVSPCHADRSLVITPTASRCRMPNGAAHTVLVPPGAAPGARLRFKVKLPTTYYSLLTTHYLLPTTHYLLPFYCASSLGLKPRPKAGLTDVVTRQRRGSCAARRRRGTARRGTAAARQAAARDPNQATVRAARELDGARWPGYARKAVAQQCGRWRWDQGPGRPLSLSPFRGRCTIVARVEGWFPC
eukprot:scaffold31309_cov41-Phaeocystis_antarctica.AAC.3